MEETLMEEWENHVSCNPWSLHGQTEHGENGKPRIVCGHRVLHGPKDKNGKWSLEKGEILGSQ